MYNIEEKNKVAKLYFSSVCRPSLGFNFFRSFKIIPFLPDHGSRHLKNKKETVSPVIFQSIISMHFSVFTVYIMCVCISVELHETHSTLH